jgi:mono/diheme cytochrome c family protein
MDRVAEARQRLGHANTQEADMQRYGLGLVVGWWLLLAIAHAAEPPPLPEEAVRLGQQYFVRYCSACHGVEGRGDGPAAVALQPPPADLTRIAQRRAGQFPAAEIATYIDGRTWVPAHGQREMPVWGERLKEIAGGGLLGEVVARSQIWLLLQYLQSVQQ